MTAPDQLRIAAAQPRLAPRPGLSVDVARAVELTARAAASGADLLLLPEGFPGPLDVPAAGEPYDDATVERMAAAAAEHGIAVCWSRVEPRRDGAHELVVYLVDRTGRTLLRAPRTHPATLPPEDTGGPIAPGTSLPTVEIAGVGIGVVICSELWLPEVARIHAIHGAEVLLSPAGGRFTDLSDHWRLLARCRAIENLCHVALATNLHGDEEGSTLIAGPEGVLAASWTDELVVADLDLARSRWLRANDDSLAEPKPFRSIPGLLRARRPELYEDLLRSVPDRYDYQRPRTVIDPPDSGAGTSPP